MHLPLVYVAKAPIIETGVGQLCDAAWRVIVVLRVAGQACMKQADVERVRDSSLELRTRLSGAWGFAKLIPWTTTGVSPRGRANSTASPRPPKTFTPSGNTSSLVIRDSASWLPAR